MGRVKGPRPLEVKNGFRVPPGGIRVPILNQRRRYIQQIGFAQILNPVRHPDGRLLRPAILELVCQYTDGKAMKTAVPLYQEEHLTQLLGRVGMAFGYLHSFMACSCLDGTECVQHTKARDAAAEAQQKAEAEVAGAPSTILLTDAH